MNRPADDAFVYLDYNATTPLDPRVADAMRPYLEQWYGNPSSGHAQGAATRRAVDRAREEAADLLGAAPADIVFTSGGTEANNHAIRGAAALSAGPGHIIASSVEHPAVTNVCRYLESRGHRVSFVPVDTNGRVDPASVADALAEDTVLVTLMHANNEVGTIQPVAEVAELAHARGVLVHSDCAQSVGKIPVTMQELGVDMLSVAGHKLYAPKGVGLLCLRPGLTLPPLMQGADHEHGRRPGTENVLGIAGLGAACRLAAAEAETGGARLAQLRDRLQTRLTDAFPAAVVHGAGAPRLPNTLSISFPGRRAWEILPAMPEVGASAGAACHGDGEIGSSVLQAMGVAPEVAAGTLRLSVGRMTTDEEIERALPAIIRAVEAAPGG